MERETETSTMKESLLSNPRRQHLGDYSSEKARKEKRGLLEAAGWPHKGAFSLFSYMCAMPSPLNLGGQSAIGYGGDPPVQTGSKEWQAELWNNVKGCTKCRCKGILDEGKLTQLSPIRRGDHH